MDMEWSELRYEQHEVRDDRDDSPNPIKDRKKSSRGEEKDHKSKERGRSRRSSDDISKEREKEAKDAEKDRGSGREKRKDERDERDKRKDDKDEREKDRSRDSKAREKDHDREKNREKERERDRDRKDRVKDKDRDKDRDIEKDNERGRDKERGKEKNKDRDKERDRDRDKDKDKAREKEREKHRDREKGRETYKDIDKEKEKVKEKHREADQDKEKSRDRVSRNSIEEDDEWGKHGGKDDKTILDEDGSKDRDTKQGKVSQYSDGEQITDDLAHKAHSTISELEERILKMKEERSKKKTDDVSEVSAWLSRSRKHEKKKNAEKKKAFQQSKIFEEQDKIVQEDSEDEETTTNQHYNLAGVKVLHGIDKVMEGGAVVLTLKDQNILADGDINEEIDMLENVEIGEQKRRDEAYKAAKKKVGIYDDKFNDDPNSEKKMLPQYDDPSTDEGITIDERGRITSEAEKKLEELRRRLQGNSTNRHFEDLNLPGKISSDYYTPEEMMQFKKPKKKKSLRKKDKLDIDALEAEAVSAGLGVGDLGSRNDAKRQAIREEQDKADAERRNNAYQMAFAKADEASKSLRQEQNLPVKSEEENLVFADDDEDFHKAVERARKITLKKKEDTPSGPEAVALLAATIAYSQTADEQKNTGELQENKVVFTEMEEFVWGLQLEEEAQKPDSEDVFMDEDEEPKASNEEIKDEPGGWTEVKETDNDEQPSEEAEEEIVPDEIIHEVAVGKGLSGALKLLKERGTLKESIDWGGRNMDKKKSKLVGIVDDEEPAQVHQKKDGSRTSSSSYSKEVHAPKVYQEKDIHIERTDEFGRILTPKEAFRIISHKFHGKGPGKMKQEKRMKQFQEELKLKQMKSSDTPSLSVERMREAQAQSKTPYLVLSGHVKPGQTSDPKSGFATVEKDLPGGLTPMLGDRKVEHFLGIKRKPEPANSGLPKKPKS